MALARTAAQYMLSDALLPDRRGARLKGLRLELPLDRVVKLVAVGFPLLLVSLAFAREFSSGKLPRPGDADAPGLRSPLSAEPAHLDRFQGQKTEEA